MAETHGLATAPLETPFEPLRWIGAYKIAKGVLSLLGGLLVLRVMHRNLPEVAIQWMTALHIEPRSELGIIILNKILSIKHRSLGWLALALFAYIPLTVGEGIGLIFRKVWAEWITAFTTFALIPLEIHEVFRRPTGLRILILILNVAVLIYIIIRLRRDHLRRLRSSAAASAKAPSPAPEAHSSQSTDPLRSARQ